MSDAPHVAAAADALAAAVEEAVREFQNTTGLAVERLDLVTYDVEGKAGRASLMSHVAPVFGAPLAPAPDA